MQYLCQGFYCIAAVGIATVITIIVTIGGIGTFIIMASATATAASIAHGLARLSVHRRWPRIVQGLNVLPRGIAAVILEAIGRVLRSQGQHVVVARNAGQNGSQGDRVDTRVTLDPWT